MATSPDVKGYLVLSIEEASGKNKDDVFCWDSNSFEGFVKGAYSWTDQLRFCRERPILQSLPTRHLADARVYFSVRS